MTWTHRVRLTAQHAVFAGQEASLMSEIIETGAWPDDQKSQIYFVDWTSIREQAQLVQRLGRKDAEAVAASFGLSDFGAAGAAVLASADLQTAIDIMNSFAPLLNLRHAIKLHVRENDIVITFHDHVKDDQRTGDPLIATDTAKVLRFLKDLFCSEQLESRNDPLATDHSICCEDLKGSLGITAHHDQISIPISLFSKGLPHASRARLVASQRDCRRIMCGLAERALCDSVRRILLQSPGAYPSVVQVAKELGMSTRTLRRRLASQHTSFLQILDEVRFQLAVRYLEDRCLTTEHIAEKLGYSESANFRAAFRRWTGSSPRHFDVRSLSARISEIGHRSPVMPVLDAGERPWLRSSHLMA